MERFSDCIQYGGYNARFAKKMAVSSQIFFLLILGDPIDERGPLKTDKRAAIHAEAPAFEEMSVEQEILVTGIKVVDLLAPYAKGGKIGLFGGAGVGKPT